jgi:hypothetical protein
MSRMRRLGVLPQIVLGRTRSLFAYAPFIKLRSDTPSGLRLRLSKQDATVARHVTHATFKCPHPPFFPAERDQRLHVRLLSDCAAIQLCGSGCISVSKMLLWRGMSRMRHSSVHTQLFIKQTAINVCKCAFYQTAQRYSFGAEAASQSAKCYCGAACHACDV